MQVAERQSHVPGNENVGVNYHNLVELLDVGLAKRRDHRENTFERSFRLFQPGLVRVYFEYFFDVPKFGNIFPIGITFEFRQTGRTQNSFVAGNIPFPA